VSANRIDSKLIDAAAGVLMAAMAQGNREAYSLAFALESACLLQSPETAAELAALRTQVAELETQTPRVRTEDLVPGDRIWHPYDMACFTVTRAASEGSAPGLQFHNRVTDEYESGMRVTGTGDRGETVHVDCAPSYLWHREDATAELERLRARIVELAAERHSTNEALSDAAEQLRVQRDRIAELETERKKYVGVEPTIAEEMAYISRCLDAVYAACDAAEKQATRWEQPLPVPEWVALIRNAADGVTVNAPALPPVSQQRQPEDPHESELHHTYELGRDLPTIPGPRGGEAL
jgi:hypothetical protein